ncbi:MAG TPA: hypothetical protein PK024_02780 [Methanospirillum sp.]|uniref:hypothetical protein n=2 Tax=Methanospirillum sp. TaxID=45200 RepID=UPI002CE3330F|nr:hypothetical protein [Methanospirillum sp.]HOJ95749.1 hypothetical protein [Methanospirillum sp.]
MAFQADKQDITMAWTSPVSIPCRSLECTTPAYSLLHLDKERVRYLHSIRKEWAVSVNDLMIAVIIRALADIAGTSDSHRVSLLTTIDLRRYLDISPATSVQNYSTAFHISMDVPVNEPIHVTAVRTKTLMDAIKNNYPGIDAAFEAERLYDSGYAAAYREIGDRWAENERSKTRIPIFSNTGIIEPFGFDSDISVRSAYILPTHNRPPGILCLLSSYGDEMTLSSTYCLPGYDPDILFRFFSRLDQAIPGYSKSPGRYEVIL